MAIESIGNIEVRTCSFVSGDTTFTQANADKDILIPVQQGGTINSGREPEVEVLQGETTAGDLEPIYGFYAVAPNGKNKVGIVTKGNGIKVARETTGNPVTDDDKGKGIRPSGTSGQDGYVVAGADKNARAAIERGEITGGNTVRGTTESPAFYIVDFG